MKTVTITIETVNAAFDPDPWPEVARILRAMADQFEADGATYAPRDTNDNVVGEVEITL